MAAHDVHCQFHVKLVFHILLLHGPRVCQAVLFLIQGVHLYNTWVAQIANNCMENNIPSSSSKRRISFLSPYSNSWIFWCGSFWVLSTSHIAKYFCTVVSCSCFCVKLSLILLVASFTFPPSKLSATIKQYFSRLRRLVEASEHWAAYSKGFGRSVSALAFFFAGETMDVSVDEEGKADSVLFGASLRFFLFLTSANLSRWYFVGSASFRSS